MTNEPVNIAIIGLGFGAEFIPIYQRHPNANMYAICQRNESSLNKIGDGFGIDKRYTSYEELLEDPDVDSVHIRNFRHELPLIYRTEYREQIEMTQVLIEMDRLGELEGNAAYLLISQLAKAYRQKP